MAESQAPITTGPAARILKVSENSVRDLERKGTLPATKTAGGIRLFDRKQVEALARVRENKGQ